MQTGWIKKNRFQRRTKVETRKIYIGSPEITLTRWTVLFSFLSFFFPTTFLVFVSHDGRFPFSHLFLPQPPTTHVTLRRIIFRLQPDDAVFSGDSRRIISAFRRYGDANMNGVSRHDDNIMIRSDYIYT